jgi:hypothetical protein
MRFQRYLILFISPNATTNAQHQARAPFSGTDFKPRTFAETIFTAHRIFLISMRPRSDPEVTPLRCVYIYMRDDNYTLLVIQANQES